MSTSKSDLLICELATLRQKAKDLVIERKQLQERLKVVDQEIYGMNSRHGKIERMEKEVAIAVQSDKDDCLPRPTWIREPSGSAGKTFVISRVTLKRIYIREQGKERETFYGRETGTTSYSFDGELNAPQSIVSWEEHQKCNT